MTGLKRILISLVVLASGCSIFQPAPVVIDTGCQVFRPIIIPAEDAPYVRHGMTDMLVQQLATHNQVGRERCGW